MELRKDYIHVSKRFFMSTFAKMAYDLAPRNLPRNIDKIMEQLGEKLDELVVGKDRRILFPRDYKETLDMVKSIIDPIKEYRELNLSEKEYEAGVDVDGPRSSSYAISDRNSITDESKLKNEFIDLGCIDAPIAIAIMHCEDGEECFVCSYRNTDRCKECILNEKYNNLYKCERVPHGKYKLSCAYDCPEGFCICCQECNKKDTCRFACPGDPDTYQQVAARVNK